MGKTSIFGTAMAGLLLISSFAQAAGCLKGAVVGGVAGHLKHHAVIGAMAGCAVGHHLAAQQAKKQQTSDAK